MAELKQKDIDIKDLSEAGFNNFLYTVNYSTASSGSRGDITRLKSDYIVGGTIGSEGVIKLGKQGLLKIDAKNKRIIINDGANDRVLIGFDANGF